MARENSFGICICGLNGCGKTTLGRELAERLGFYPMDVESYYFSPDDVTYASPRPREHVIASLLADMEKHPRFVFSAVCGEADERIAQRFSVVIYLETSREIRASRLQKRMLARFGARAEQGGDLYAQQQDFLRFALQRETTHIEQWLAARSCPVLRLDASLPISELIAQIMPVIENPTA